MARVTRHLYRCPLRWADMDALGHVNNVTYVDYLQEARVDVFRVHAPMQGGEELAEGVVVVRHEVDYLAPLEFRRAPVSIDVWVTEVRAASFTLAYEVFDERPEPRPRTGRLPRDSGMAIRHRYDCQVRFSDVDLYRHVNNVKYYEYLQEARIDLLRLEERAAGEPELSVVVVAVGVEYSPPIPLRPQPDPGDTWVEAVGRSSVTLASEVSDGREPLARARAVVVGFDPTSSRSEPLPPWLRQRLGKRLAGQVA